MTCRIRKYPGLNRHKLLSCLFLAVIISGPGTTAAFLQTSSVPAYRNPNLPVEERVTDLLSRMSLEEKVRQMDMYSG
ncbi:MAG: hypothetical protein ACREDR_14335, partial [Blastocatellia bacterium]